MRAAENRDAVGTTAEKAITAWSMKDPRNVTREDVRTELENAQNGLYVDGSYIPLRINTPSILINKVRDHSKGDVEIKNLPIIMNVGKVRQAMEETDDADVDNKAHGIDVDGMLTIVEKMNAPAYIVLQENGRYVEVVKYYDKGKHAVWAVLDFNEQKREEQMLGSDIAVSQLTRELQRKIKRGLRSLSKFVYHFDCDRKPFLFSCPYLQKPLKVKEDRKHNPSSRHRE